MEKRSFWSSAPGIITGVAGLLSAMAALVGLLVTFGVIGGKDSNTKATSGGTAAQAPNQPNGSTGTTTAVTPTFSVSPKDVKLNLVAREGKVTVSNTGESPLSVRSPVVSGSGAAQFAVKDLSCTGTEIGLGDTCQMAVTFTPGTTESDAKLTITVKGAPPQTVSLRGAAL
ncbi:MAG: hypothetical protein M3Z84_07870 [Actinomycetota bacterium]|nr:hypothetical protein [Actinomycetota bacterium]